MVIPFLEIEVSNSWTPEVYTPGVFFSTDSRSDARELAGKMRSNLGHRLGIFFLALMPAAVANAESHTPDVPDTAIGGPESIGVALSQDDDDRPATSRFRLGKDRLREDYGFDFNFDFAALGQTVQSGPQAASGVFRLYGKWTPFARGTGHPGSLIWKFEYRGSGGGSPPSSVAGQIGYVGQTAVSFQDVGWFVAPFYWQQQFDNRRQTLVVGRLDPLDFLDISGYASQWLRFQNAAVLANPTIPLPDLGFGAGYGIVIGDKTVIGATIHDANGKVKSLEFFADGNETFKQLYISYAPLGRERRFDRAFSLTMWQQDERKTAKVGEGYGLGLSANWLFDSGWMPFSRIGIAGGTASRSDRAVVLGTLYRPGNGVGEFGVGYSWEKLVDRSLGSQQTIESFFRWDVNQHVSITPSVQVLLNPARSTSDKEILFGLRMRFTY